jgi:hypothetical protein
MKWVCKESVNNGVKMVVCRPLFPSEENGEGEKDGVPVLRFYEGGIL